MVPDYLTIAEAARLIEKRELSPVDLVDSRLDRVARLDGRLHSFIRVLADAARHEARAAAAEIASGKYRGPLHGIPIGLKDIYETAGVATTGHSKVMQDHVPHKDAFSVQWLREAGAIVIGKLATHEFALGGPSFDLPWPPARNPWDLRAGAAPPPRIDRRTRPGDGRPRPHADRRHSYRGAADRRDRQVRDVRAAITHDAIQRDRQPRNVGVLRLYRHRPAVVVPRRSS